MPGERQHDDLALRLPVRAESVGVGRRAAAQFAEQAGCDDDTVCRVRLSVSEALTNVVLHAHPAGEETHHHVVLQAERRERAIAITVSDEGAGLRARADSPGLGLGLGIISSSTDEFAVDAAPGGGTLLRMTFLR